MTTGPDDLELAGPALAVQPNVLPGELELALDRARYACSALVSWLASVGQRTAAGVPEHVWMNFEAELRLDPRPFNHAGEASRPKWRSPS
jgi:hypothetical protein